MRFTPVRDDIPSNKFIEYIEELNIQEKSVIANTLNNICTTFIFNDDKYEYHCTVSLVDVTLLNKELIINVDVFLNYKSSID